MRNGLREWVTTTLLGNKSLNRGYFKPAVVQTYIDEHMLGKNHDAKLGVLLSLELWHQMYIDYDLAN